MQTFWEQGRTCLECSMQNQTVSFSYHLQIIVWKYSIYNHLTPWPTHINLCTDFYHHTCIHICTNTNVQTYLCTLLYRHKWCLKQSFSPNLASTMRKSHLVWSMVLLEACGLLGDLETRPGTLLCSSPHCCSLYRPHTLLCCCDLWSSICYCHIYSQPGMYAWKNEAWATITGNEKRDSTVLFRVFERSVHAYCRPVKCVFAY